MLSTSKVVAGGLAAAVTAVLGSYFGALGTVGGAAAGAIVTTLTGELFQRSIDRTAGALRPGGSGGPGSPDTARGGSLIGVVVGSVLVFALGMGAVTGVEYVTREPLSGGEERTTTIGHLAHLDVGSAVDDLVGGSDGDPGGDSGKDGLLGGLLGR